MPGRPGRAMPVPIAQRSDDSQCREGLRGPPQIAWAGYLQDWDRTMRSRNHPDTTRYNFVLAAAQLARYLKVHSPDYESDAAAGDPAQVTKRHVEAFQAWVIEARSASTAPNKHKCL